ncbi:MAG TPA: transketolase family protein [Victivallales bacterium]|nr:transketolase family protein [Victivallales bacterium]
MKDMELRKVYADTLIELAEQDKKIVLLEADLMKASGTGTFKEKFPGRTFDVGVAEANMVGVASGLSASGKIPFANTFGCFAGRRTYDQFFISANYAKQNVKLVGTDPGVSAEFNGGTHMPFEDAGIMRNIPGLVVVEACDPVSLKKLTKEIAYHNGCVYMRVDRKKKGFVIYDENEAFELGKGKVVIDGSDITLIANGSVMVEEAIGAQNMLSEEGISAAVIDMHTIKPLDDELVLKYAEKTGAIVTCENHQIYNGLGSAVAEVLSENHPTLLKRVGVNDEFGEVGTLDYLKKRFGMTKENIYNKAKELLVKKNNR